MATYINKLKWLVDGACHMSDNEAVHVELKTLRGIYENVRAVTELYIPPPENESLRAQVRSLEEDLKVAVDERDRALDKINRLHEESSYVSLETNAQIRQYAQLREALDKMLDRWYQWSLTKELDALVCVLDLTNTVITEQAKWVEPGTKTAAMFDEAASATRPVTRE